MKSIFKRSAAILLAALILLAAVPGFAAQNESCSWMKKIRGGTPITAINIPGTHDSATQYVNFSAISKTQELSVYQQLCAGVRFLDIRLEKTEDGFIAVHSAADCREGNSVFSEKLTAAAIIADCRKFLKENPSETILFKLKEDDGDAGKAFYSAFYDLYIRNSRSLWYIKNAIPTLGQVRGKIVLLRQTSIDETRFSNNTSGIDFSHCPYIGGRDRNDFRRGEITKLSGKKYASVYVQDTYKLEGSRKLEEVRSFLGKKLNPSEFNICFTSCTGMLVLPETNARIINKALLEDGFEKGRYYGIIAADFITEELSAAIYKSNFA